MCFTSISWWKKPLFMCAAGWLLVPSTGFLPPAFAADEKKEDGDKVERVRRPAPKKKDKEEKKREDEFNNNVGDKIFSHEQFDSTANDEAKVDALILLDSSG